MISNLFEGLKNYCKLYLKEEIKTFYVELLNEDFDQRWLIKPYN
tara:strand:+ start:444 stop:575 length:132 start_codon:yes stop_codon:yes gene_type:complete